MIDMIIKGGCSIIKLLIVGNRKLNVHCKNAVRAPLRDRQHINVDPFCDVIPFH